MTRHIPRTLQTEDIAMKIKLNSVYVDDQDKTLRFYTDVLGFATDDVKAEYERIKARGAEFTMPPTAVTGSTITLLNDTCGHLIQITQLARW
jgi:predicted enzyme related to lactoylglutathione lyase